MANFETKNLKLTEENKLLKKELKQYKKAYNEMYCYFDSISDDEQELLSKRLDRIFKLK
jgi:hypothetical protein